MSDSISNSMFIKSVILAEEEGKKLYNCFKLSDKLVW